MGANAQFEEGTKYVGASLTGLNISYSSGEKFGLGLQGTAGYFFADSWMLTGRLEYTHQWMPAGQRDRNEVVLGAVIISSQTVFSWVQVCSISMLL